MWDLKDKVWNELCHLNMAIRIYEELHIDGKLPKNLDELYIGLTAEDSIDGVMHRFFSIGSQFSDGCFIDGIFKDPFGEDYLYDTDERFIMCKSLMLKLHF